MSNKKDGGAAFPRPASEYTERGTCPDGNDPILPQQGMSLRDYFAGQALAGIMMQQGFIAAQARSWDYAQAAYKLADAMLKAREE